MRATQRNILLAVSHLIVLAAGYAIHRGSRSPALEVSAPAPSVPTVMKKAEPVKPLPLGSLPGEGPWSANDLRKAWHALKDSSLPPEELVILRGKLRREWLAKDLRSALMTWADEETLNASDIGNEIQSLLQGHEEEMVDWILAGDFGLDGHAVLECWADKVGGKDRGVMLRSMGKIPGEYREEILRLAFRWPMKAEEMDACVQEFAKLPDGEVKTSAWKAMLRGVVSSSIYNNGPDRIHELISRGDIPEEARHAGLGFLAGRIVQTPQPAKALEDFRKLSKDDQSAMAPQLLEMARSSPMASETAVPNALTMFCESENWEIFMKDGPGAIGELLDKRKQNAGEVSRWALQLPAREETSGTFRRAVAGRFLENLGEGAAWARSLPEGWHREQALAQLAVSADQQHKNAAVRDEALAEITDPAIQEEMREWRQSEAVAK